MLRHAIVTPSFIPPRWQRELRDLTRRRRKVIHAATSEKNRVEKTLEDANVKLSSVLSDILSVSGQLMLKALLKGKADPTEIAQFAKKTAKKKIPQIIAALEEHQMSDHHRLMIRFSLEHLRFLEHQIYQLDEEISKKIREGGYERHWELLQTVPAVGEPNAATILAEMGPDPQNFANEKHLVPGPVYAPATSEAQGKTRVATRPKATAGYGCADRERLGYCCQERWPSATQVLAACC